MAKKLNNVYLEENEELETHKILMDGKKPHKKKPAKKGGIVWAIFRPVVIFAASLFIVGVLIYNAYYYVVGNYLEPVDINDSEKIEITIPSGSSTSTISDILYEAGIVKSAEAFMLYTDFSDSASNLKAGDYLLSKDMEFDEIIYTLQKSVNSSPTVDVTLPEGLNVPQFAERLVIYAALEDVDEYLEIAKTGEGVSVPLALQEEGVNTEDRIYLLEGYLFPDTYEFFREGDAVGVVERQLDQFENKFTDEFYTRAAELEMSVDEIITLASMIEKESKVEQFSQVSAVFHNRLNLDMPMQSDATIAYALGIENKFDLSSEIEQESPYNTHLNTGLPVGPICNPSLAAITAALYPDQTYIDAGYIFFTLTDPETGELAFNINLEDHQAVVDEWKPVWDEHDRAAGF